MPRMKIAGNWFWLLLWLSIIFSALYARPPMPIDETRYLSVAWEMWQNHEFLVPHSNGLPYSQKPPLFFWAIHLFWWLFGVGEWQGRLVGPFFGLLAVFLTVKLARRLWPENQEIGKNVPFFLLGMLVWSLFSSLTMFDSLLTCCCLFAQIQILNAERDETIFPWLLTSIALGLALLAKGPVALVFIGPPMLLAPWWSKRRGRFWIWWYCSSFVTLAAGLAIALCWAIPAAIKGGAAYGQDILFGQTSGRVVHAFAHERPFYWYFLLLPLLCFPWTFLCSMWRGWKVFFAEQSNRFCLVVLGSGLLILSCVSGKQVHYALPLLPFFALSIARMTDNARVGWLDRVPLVMVLIIGAIAIYFVTHRAQSGGDREILNLMPSWLWSIPLMACLPLLFFRSEKSTKSVKIVATSSVLIFIVLHLAIANTLQSRFRPTDITQDLRTVQAKGQPVAVFPAHLADQFQFDGRLTTTMIKQYSWHDLALWANAHPKGACLFFTKTPTYNLLVADGRVTPYKDGWLIFRRAKNFYASYENWVFQQLSQHE